MKGEKAMIDAVNLEKHFGPKAVVKGVDIRVEPGQVVGLLGPNGAGKTTTLRMLSTTLLPSAGGATIAGYDVVREPEKVRAVIGVLPTDPGLYGRLTATENLRFYGKLHGMQGAPLEKRINQLLDQLELTAHKDEPTESFSKGMKQKVALARCILHDPPVLILDEPTAGLDVLAGRIVINFIREARRQGRAILFSSHYLLEAERVCDRVSIIGDGHILAAGTPEEVCQQAAADSLEDAFVALAYGDPASTEVAQ